MSRNGLAYSKEKKARISNEILEHMQKGVMPHTACKLAGISHGHFRDWRLADPELDAAFSRARLDMCEALAAQLIDIGDQPPPVTPDGKMDWPAFNQRKLQSDNRKYLLGKLSQAYADKIKIVGDADQPLVVKQTLDATGLSTAALAEIMALRDKNAAD